MSHSLDRVVYKPLGVAEDPNEDDEDEEEEEEEGRGVADDVEQPFARPKLLDTVVLAATRSNKHHQPQLLNLSLLRAVLYLLACLLFLTFVLQLLGAGSSAGNGGKLREEEEEAEAVATRRLGQHHAAAITTINQDENDSLLSVGHRRQDTAAQYRDPRDDVNIHQPSVAQYKSYLASVLNEYNQRALANNSEPRLMMDNSIDDLHFPPESHSGGGGEGNLSHQWWQAGSRGPADQYVTLSNYIRAMKSFSHNASVTLTTQATTEFMYHSLELCKRWDGPISLAIYAPGVETQVAISLIKFMRLCLPSPLSACIRDKITWHLAYPKSHAPPQQPSAITTTYPKFNLDLKNFPLFVNQDQCPKFKGPEPVDLIKQFHEDLNKKNQLEVINYRQKNSLPYPINVLRNMARQASMTKYVLASDIELYPSINMVPLFVNYLSNHNVKEEYQVDKFVFALPIFEVDAKVEAPKTKQELVSLMRKGQAVFFHRYVCDACQNFPNRMDWLLTDKFGLNNYKTNNQDELVIFDVTRRNKTRSEWEPIFIGTNNDPIYDDRLTWDGRRDKMGQMFEMCLMDYKLLIAGNAFLVHAPGIKRLDKNDAMKRINYIRENNLVYETTLSGLRQRYASSQNINIC